MLGYENDAELLILVTHQSIPTLQAFLQAHPWPIFKNITCAFLGGGIEPAALAGAPSQELQRLGAIVSQVSKVEGFRCSQSNLTATLSIIPAETQVGQEIIAQGQVQSDQNNLVVGAQVVLSWDDGKVDTTVLTGDNGHYSVAHMYTLVGAYTVTARASRADFTPATITQQVRVSPAPPPPEPCHDLVIVGTTTENVEHGLLGWAGQSPVALNLTVGRIPETGEEKAQTISLFGVQGSGKSYTTGVIMEMALKSLPQITHLEHPLAGIIFHYSQNEGYAPEYAGMRHPNQVERDVSELEDRLDAAPAGIEDLVVLVPASRLKERREEFPDLNVQPLYFDPAELGLEDWQLLMGVPGSEALYMEQIKALLQNLRQERRVDVENLREAVEGSAMTVAQKRLVAVRLDLASRYLRKGASLRDYVQPGRLTILDIRDSMIDRVEAMRLCLISLRLFQNVKVQGRSIPKLIVLDEAHKYLHTDFADEIDTVVREMRHTATSVAIASQDPPSIPEKVIGLSSMVVLHRMTSPDWLRHIKRGCAGMTQLEAHELSSLGSGEAYLWAKEATDPRFTTSAVKVRIRPRVTQHGL